MDITKLVKTTLNPNDREQKTAFIPAFLEDNVIGLDRDPGYEDRLMARDPTTAEALRFGKWSVFAGQMFREFSKPIHVCAPVEIPLHWVRWRSIDWGWAAPWCCLWYAKDPDSRRVYVYREAYEVGLTDPRQAERIRELSLPGEKFTFTFADPSMWTKRTTEIIAKSTAQAYSENGVLLTKADNDQRSKISKTRQALANIHDSKPAVMIFDTCPNLIRTLPALMSDPKNPETILDGQEDHPWDSFAYGLTNWTAPNAPAPTDKPKPQRSPLMGVKGL